MLSSVHHDGPFEPSKNMMRIKNEKRKSMLHHMGDPFHLGGSKQSCKVPSDLVHPRYETKKSLKNY